MGEDGIKIKQLWYAIQLILLIQATCVLCYQYKVGDLSAWNLPSSANKLVYSKWIKNHNFKIGDTLLFLYPPSQDSVIQVTKESYNSCNLKDPILYMNNGNSLFNITSTGVFYFTSGTSGHCEKLQKLQVNVLYVNGSIPSSDDLSPSYGPAASPSYQNAFGTIPAPPSPSSSSSSSSPALPTISIFMSVLIVFLMPLAVTPYRI